jgi:hypothetical protein
MNKLIQTFTLTIAAAAVATPVCAETFVPPRVLTAPVVVHNGTAAALNTQPIPPGHSPNVVRAITAGSSFLQTLDMHALNTQPIPPGHGTFSTQTGGRGGKKRHSGHGSTSRWDVSKNAKS